VADFEVDCGVVVVVVVVVAFVPSDDEEEASLVEVDVAPEEVVWSPEDGVVVVVAVVAVLEAPGCSLATTTPTIAVEAAAAITADCVIRRNRSLARRRAWVASCSMGWFTVASLSGVPSSNQPGLSLDRESPVRPV
jgi:hypothetical protein